MNKISDSRIKYDADLTDRDTTKQHITHILTLTIKP